MKRILSMLLVLCMVTTTLMGVMVMDVSAATWSVDNSTDPRTWTATMNGKSANIIATGNWVIKPNTKHASGDASYDLGTITSESILGKSYYHFDFNDIDYKEGATATSILADANYIRFRADVKDAATDAEEPSNTYDQMKSIALDVFNNTLGGTTDADGNVTYGGVIRYTFYAFTQDKNTEVFTFQIGNPGSTLGALEIPAAQLYSENGIPHKVDVYIWSNSPDKTIAGSTAAGKSSEVVYYNAVVDGVTSAKTSSYGENKENLWKKATAIQPIMFLLFSPAAKNEYSFKGSDWYISHDGNKDYTILTRDNLDETSFVDMTVPNSGATITFKNKTNNVSGVIASVDEALEAAVVKKAGTDRTVEIFNSVYNDPAAIFTGDETNVYLVDKETGKPVASADVPEDATMDDYYLMVNGVYILATSKDDYVYANKTAFTVSAAKNGKVDTRVKNESYLTATAPTPYGGMEKGFIKFTSEPRGSFTFNNSEVFYERAGYKGLNLPGSSGRATSYAELPKKATVEFDIYIPEYTASKTVGSNITVNSVKLLSSAFTQATGDSEKALSAIIFTTANKVNTIDDGIKVDVEPNSWNTVSVQYDATDAEKNGNLTVRVYLNGDSVGEATTNNAAFKTMGKNYHAFIRYMRLYMPTYTSIGVTEGKWYIGDYIPGKTGTTTATIEDGAVNGVTVYEDDSLLTYDSSVYQDENNLVEAMGAKGYVPVYEYAIDEAVIDAAYDVVDGIVTTEKSVSEDENYITTTYTHTGKLIRNWLQKCTETKYFTKTANGDGTNTYTKTTATSNNGFVSAVDNPDGTSTIVMIYKKSADGKNEYDEITNTTVYDDVASTVDDIIAWLATDDGKAWLAEKYPNRTARTETLVGFAANSDDGLLPRVYTLQEAGTRIYTSNYDVENGSATVEYRKFDNTTGLKFIVVVAAYETTSKGSKMLAVDVSAPYTVDATAAMGASSITFPVDNNFKTNAANAGLYKVFVLEDLTSATPLLLPASK